MPSDVALRMTLASSVLSFLGRAVGLVWSGTRSGPFLAEHEASFLQRLHCGSCSTTWQEGWHGWLNISTALSSGALPRAEAAAAGSRTVGVVAETLASVRWRHFGVNSYTPTCLESGAGNLGRPSQGHAPLQGPVLDSEREWTKKVKSDSESW